jgi:transcriptional regulator with XRE-family HTH domain
MNDERARRLGEYIKAHREAQNLTILTLASRAGIDDGGLSRLEHGKVPYPRPNTLCAVATALHLPLADLYALAGYVVPDELPSIKPYLHAKYAELPEDVITELCDEIDYACEIHRRRSG